MEWKMKEATGDFTPMANKDALYMVLGKDHYGRVRGKGGVRQGVKKVFGAEYKVTRLGTSGKPPESMEDLDERMKDRFRGILEHLNLPILDELFAKTPEDKGSHPTQVKSNGTLIEMQPHIETPPSHPPTHNLEVVYIFRFPFNDAHMYVCVCVYMFF